MQYKQYISSQAIRALNVEQRKVINHYKSYVRKKVNCITFLFDKIPPVFHKLT